MSTLPLFFLTKVIRLSNLKKLNLEYLVMMGGIIISVAVVSTAMNLFEGYQQTLQKILLDSSAHIYVYSQIEPNISPIKIDTLASLISNQALVKCTNPVYINSAMVKVSNKFRGCMIRAYPSDSNYSHMWFQPYLKKKIENLDKNYVIIGNRLANDLNIREGDNITLLNTQMNKILPLGIIPTEKNFSVKSIIQTGYYEYDRSLIIMNSSDAYFFYNIEPQYTCLEVYLKNNPIKNIPIVTAKLKSMLNDNWQVNNWLENNGNLFSLITVEKWLIFLIFSFLILLSAINSISTVSTVILEKKNDLAILRSMGASLKVIHKIVYYKILFISIISIIIGLLLGVIFSWLITQQTWYQLRGDVYFIDKIFMQVSMYNYLIIYLLSTVIISICIRVPLNKLNKMQVIDVLRGKDWGG